MSVSGPIATRISAESAEVGIRHDEAGSGLPVGWNTGKLGNLCALVNGRGFKPHEWGTVGLPIIRIQNLNGSEEFNYYPGIFDPKIVVEEGQLLFAWSGSRGTSFGPHIWGGGKALLNYHTWKVLPSGSLYPAFFYYALQSLTETIEHRAHGASALVHMQKWEMEQFVLSVPVRDEQIAIAGALSDVDALIGALDKLIAKKHGVKLATMQQLLTGTTRLLGFHGEWEKKQLGELFDFTGGYSASRDQLSDEGYCYLHYGDIHMLPKVFVDVKAEYQDIPKLAITLKNISPKSMLNDGDVVFVDASEDDEGTSKHVVVVNKDNVPFISGLHTIVAKDKTAELTHEYRGYCFQTAAVRRQFLFYAVGTKVSGISKTNIAKLIIPVPSIPEQLAIAAILTDVDAEIGALERRREKTKAIKQGMMQQLLTGRIRLVKPGEKA